MRRIMLKAKIHHARVTETNINYEGSLSLDEELMTAADMLPYEKVHRVGDTLIVVSYVILEEEESGSFAPRILLLGAGNKIVQIK